MSTGSRVAVTEVETAHQRLMERLPRARTDLGRPLRLTDKLLASHAETEDFGVLDAPGTAMQLTPDRLALPDSSAQTAMLQFITANRRTVACPTTIHCDHLIRARLGGEADLATSLDENSEVYEFLSSASARHGIGLWGPGSGIIHQVLLERYAYPGGMLLGADSHTPNAGGLGMLAIGSGGAQAVDVMVGLPVEIPCPRVIGVELTGRLRGFTSAKDVILTVATRLTVSGGTGAIIEYFGDGARSLSATGKATICNMGAELGATTSIFGYDAAMARYLDATGRRAVRRAADAVADALVSDPQVVTSPSRYYDELVHIDLDTLQPQIVGPHSPDRGRSVTALSDEIDANDWPAEPTNALVGSCTNSSYEDIGRAAHIARQAADAGLRVRVPLLVTPGSETIRATIERDGLLGDLEAIGATVLANACGPCIGQWTRDDVTAGETNSIVTSFNRNFPGRNDGSAQTLAFIASPEIVVSAALAGTLRFDPDRDALDCPDGSSLTLEAPLADELPGSGFVDDASGFQAPVDPGEASPVAIRVRPDSERLQLLEPFPPWDRDAYTNLPVLLKVAGKCTTDHISPAGKWLRWRGHLDRISDNLFTGAENAFTDEAGTGIDQLDGTVRPLHEIARRYRDHGLPWVAVGDANYGEGSSREHAAMEPRHLGCIAVLVRSFARIHETNLKKHGILPLTFADPSDHDRIEADDRIDVAGLETLAPDVPLELTVRPATGDPWPLVCRHTLSDEHIRWFRAGSALNALNAS